MIAPTATGAAAFADLLGGVFARGRRVARATMHRTSGALEAEGCGLPSTVEIVDEVYRHRLVRPVDVWYRWDDGEPAVWTTTFGSGRGG